MTDQRTPFGNFLREVGDDLAALRAVRPVPVTGIPWRRLSNELELPPQPGESLRSLVARACAANFLPNSWGLLQYLGLVHRNRVHISEDPTIDAAELAYAMRVAVEDVAERRYAPLAPKHFAFFGLDLHGGRLVKDVRRFAPSALLTGEFHRATWELRDIPFCLESWEMLEDTCWCEPRGVVQKWTRTKTRVHECDQCGDPLTWIEAVPVPDEMRDALSILTALVDPVEGRRAEHEHLIPEALRDVDRGRLFHMVRALAFGVDPHAEGRSSDRPAERLYGLYASCRALLAWPHGIKEVVWHQGSPPTASNSFHTRWLALGGVLPRRGVVGGRPFTPERPPWIGIRPATEVARLSPETLKFAWAERLVTPHQRVHGPQTLAAYDPEELPGFGAMWNARVSAITLADRLGMPPYGIEQLVALGGLVADAPAMPGTGLHFHPATAAGLADRLLDAETSDRLDDPVPLCEALILVGGRLKPWGPIVMELLGGLPGDPAIPFRLEGEGPLLKRVEIDARSVPWIAALSFDPSKHPSFAFSERMSQGDALALLNVSNSGARLLAGLKPVGINPKSYALADVLGRALTIASVAEVAARLDLSVHRAWEHARTSGWREIIPGGWDRRRLDDESPPAGRKPDRAQAASRSSPGPNRASSAASGNSWRQQK